MATPFKFPFTTDIRVRGYELDTYHHVNNAVYLNWLEHARWELAAAGGFSVWDPSAQPVVRAVELDYRHDTRLGEALRIMIWPRRVGSTSFTFGNSIRILESPFPDRAGQLALVGSVTMVCLRTDGSGKVTVPDGWRAMFPTQDPGPEPPAM